MALENDNQDLNSKIEAVKMFFNNMSKTPKTATIEDLESVFYAYRKLLKIENETI